MKSLFEQDTYDEIMGRLQNISADAQPVWGKMNNGQMLRHCQFPLEVALEKRPLPKPNFVMKLIMKSFKKSMYSDKPWKKGLPTTKMFKVEDEREFLKEKNALIDLVNEFYESRSTKTRKPHPAFGEFTYEQWGQMQYKHLDHHLRQFGV